MKNHDFSILGRDEPTHSRAIRRHIDVSDRAVRRARHRRRNGHGRHYNDLGKAVVLTIHVLFITVMSAMLVVLLLETTSGCGQTQYHADGRTTPGKCLFLPQRGTTGRWK